MKPHHFLFSFISFALIMTGLMSVSCTVDSADTVIRSVSVDVTGVYRNSNTNENDGKLVSKQSGRQTTFLNLRQTGDQLEANDNNNIIFQGTIGNIRDSRASFNLNGSTTAGNAVTITGNIKVENEIGTMRATWIEDSLYGNVIGIANGVSSSTNSPQPDPDDEEDADS